MIHIWQKEGVLMCGRMEIEAGDTSCHRVQVVTAKVLLAEVCVPCGREWLAWQGRFRRARRALGQPEAFTLSGRTLTPLPLQNVPVARTPEGDRIRSIYGVSAEELAVDADDICNWPAEELAAFGRWLQGRA